jgi:hypothetical protein
MRRLSALPRVPSLRKPLAPDEIWLHAQVISLQIVGASRDAPISDLFGIIRL